jgi:hypothetical protein
MPRNLTEDYPKGTSTGYFFRLYTGKLLQTHENKDDEK